MRLITAKHPVFLVLFIVFCLMLLFILPPLARAQSGATQQLTGRINSGEEMVFYRLPDRSRGETLYVLMQATTGNLDPFV